MKKTNKKVSGKWTWIVGIAIIILVVLGGYVLSGFLYVSTTAVNLGPAPPPQLSIWVKDKIPYSWIYPLDVNSISITFSGVQIHFDGDKESVWSSPNLTNQNIVDLVKIEKYVRGPAIAYCPLPTRRVDSLKIMISDASVTINQTNYKLSVPSDYQTGIKVPVAYGDYPETTMITLTIDLNNTSLHNHVFIPTFFEAKYEK